MTSDEQQGQVQAPQPGAGSGGGIVSKIVMIAAVILGGLGVLAVAYLEAKSQGGSAKGEPAPDFVIEKFGGGTISLADARARGSVVMLDFWATWCGPCVEELPSLVKVAKEYESKGVVFVAANHDGDDDAKVSVALFLERMPELAPYTGFADDLLARRFNVQALPTLVFIGKDGKLIETNRGALSERQLRNRIEEALESVGAD